MTKKQQTLLTLAALALPLSAFAVDMPGGIPAKAEPTGMGMPAEASVTILPAAPLALPFQMEGLSSGSNLKPAAAQPLADDPGEKVIPFPSVTGSFWSLGAAPVRQKAAKSDAQAMLAPNAVVPADMDVSKMSGDQASGAGQAIMDRILYQVSARNATGPASPVAGSEGSSAAALKPASRRIHQAVWSVPNKIAQVTTDYVSKKTGMGPRLTAALLGLPQMVAGIYMMVDAALGQGIPLSWGIAGYLAFGIIMTAAYGGVLNKFQRQADARNLATRAGQLEAQLKGVPGVVAVKAGQAKLTDGEEDVVVVQVSRLDSSNIAKIPKKAGRYSVHVEFVN